MTLNRPNPLPFILLLVGVITIYFVTPSNIIVTGSTNHDEAPIEVPDELVDIALGRIGLSHRDLENDEDVAIGQAENGDQIAVRGHAVNHLTGSTSNQYSGSNLANAIAKCLGSGVTGAENTKSVFLQDNGNHAKVCGRFVLILRCSGNVWEFITAFGFKHEQKMGLIKLRELPQNNSCG